MTPYARLSRDAQIRRLRGIARQALTLYGIEPVSLSLLSHYFNTTYKVTLVGGERFVLRVQRPGEDPAGPTRRRSNIASELWWLQWLRTYLQLPVPDVVITPDGDNMVEIPTGDFGETQPCVLFRWMEGRFLYRQLAPTHLTQVGRLTAQLHNASERLSLPPWLDRQRVDLADLATEEHAAKRFTDLWSTEAAETVRAAFRLIRETQEDLGRDRRVFGLIHADIHQLNYLFDRGALRLIDFDDCGWGHYLYDFAVTLNQLTRHPRQPALREALISGYRELRELSRAQESMIDSFYMLRELQDLTWFVAEGESSAYPDWRGRVAAGLSVVERFVVR